MQEPIQNTTKNQILESKIYSPSEQIPLLVFHGLFGMKENWGSFARSFSEKMPVHTVDLRNHGKSFHHEQMSLDIMADDIKNYLDFHGIEKANLLGHSLGARAVMQFSMLYPQMVNRLVLVDMAPKAYPPSHQKMFDILQQVDFSLLSSRKEVEAFLQEKIEQLSVVQFLLRNLYWETPGLLAWRFSLPFLQNNYTALVSRGIRYGEFQGETLFVAGEKSNYILPQDKLLMKQLFPKYTLEIIPNAGHWVQADKPEEFFEIASEFFNNQNL